MVRIYRAPLVPRSEGIIVNDTERPYEVGLAIDQATIQDAMGVPEVLYSEQNNFAAQTSSHGVNKVIEIRRSHSQPSSVTEHATAV